MKKSQLFISATEKSPIYQEVLDYILTSPSVNKLIEEINIIENQVLGSDHNPIIVQMKLNTNKKYSLNNGRKVMLYHTANWEKYRTKLNEFILNDIGNSNTEESALNITRNIKDAIKISVPSKIIYDNIKQPFPPHIVNLIKIKNELSKINRLNKINGKCYKTSQENFNISIKKVNQAISKHNNDSWNEFIKNLGPSPMSTKK
jgi:hypothetical protein